MLGAVVTVLQAITRFLWDAPTFTVGLTLLFQGRLELTWSVIPLFVGTLLLDMQLFSVIGNAVGSRRLRAQLAVFSQQHPSILLEAHSIESYVDVETLERLRAESEIHMPNYFYEVVQVRGTPMTIVFSAHQTFQLPGLVIVTVPPSEIEDVSRFLVYHEAAHGSMWGLGTRFFADGYIPRFIGQAIVCTAVWAISPLFAVVAFALYGYARWRVEVRDAAELDECRAHAIAIWSLPDGTNFDTVLAATKHLGGITDRQLDVLRRAVAQRSEQGRLSGDPLIEEPSGNFWYLAVAPIAALTFVSAAAPAIAWWWFFAAIVALRVVDKMIATSTKLLVTTYLDRHLVHGVPRRGPYPWTGNSWLE